MKIKIRTLLRIFFRHDWKITISVGTFTAYRVTYTCKNCGLIVNHNGLLDQKIFFKLNRKTGCPGTSAPMV